MIIVNVVFGEMNKAYDFKVDETEKIRLLVDERVGMIAEKEHLNVSKHSGLFLLCDQKRQKVFSPDSTLSEQQVAYGDTLFLI